MCIERIERLRADSGNLGHCVEVTYRKENQKLAEQILASGGAGTFPAPQNFPIRKRIISEFSIGVLVIESGE